MYAANRFVMEDTPQSRQLRAGFPWLILDGGLEAEFRRTHLEENLRTVRVNLCLGVIITLAFAAVEAVVLAPAVNRIPSLIHLLLIVPILLISLAASFSPRRHRIYAPLALATGTVLGLSMVAMLLITASNAPSPLFPCLLVTTVFVYFMGGPIFYHSLAANVSVALVYLVAGGVLQFRGEFGYDALCLVAVNIFCAVVAYMHEKTSRLRFLEAGLLHEMAARDGLTGIQNRRMFDQHIERIWLQGLRENTRIAVLLADIDCFKDYNDRYGHQAGDECLRAVAVSLNQCARRPLDFVARYGGEEFAVILYEANREYVAEVLTRIQRSIAELNIPHDASPVASRLTVSVGAALILPSAHRSPEGLVQLADEALYNAKEQGRNRVVVMEAEYQELHTGRFEKHRASRAV
ncbi:MAG TPA: diguanylate cyclase [Steroidobacteraceae bacterium]|nr:diguanylate cyclase [Steroidobacteraceae bacterium]